MRLKVFPGGAALTSRLTTPFAVFVLLAVLASGCSRETPAETHEIAYASEASGDLRDQLGPKSRVIAQVNSGQKLEILERLNRWARVRVQNEGQSAGKPPLEGWMHQRQMVSERVFLQFQELSRQSADLPPQGSGLVRRLANMRFQPGRNTQTFYQLASDEPIELLRHTIAGREATAEELQRGMEATLNEDWLLVRASGNRTGWVLESLAELVPPLEIARYREGQRIRAWFVLYREQDSDEVHPWYLWATVPRLTADTHDFEEIRVFVWNPAASRYETSYRERGLKGLLPIRVTPPESGQSPEFSFEIMDDQGSRTRRQYYMLGRQVRLRKQEN
jgi:hypothetical protein